MMDARTFAQLGLLALGGSVHGKTKYQKSIYFLGLMTGCRRRLSVIGLTTTVPIRRTSPKRWIGSGSSGPWTSHPRVSARSIRQALRSGVTTTDLTQGTLLRREHGAVRIMIFAEGAEGRGFPRESRRHGLRLAFDRGQDLFPPRSEARTRDSRGASNFATRFGWEVSPPQLEQAGTFLEKLGLIEVAPIEEDDSPDTYAP